MSSDPHEIFVTEEDYWNWDKYIQQCDLINLSDVDKRHARDAYQYLRGVLGRATLKKYTSRATRCSSDISLTRL